MSPQMTVSSLGAHTPHRLTRGAELPASAVRGHGDARTRPASVAVALPTAERDGGPRLTIFHENSGGLHLPGH